MNKKRTKNITDSDSNNPIAKTVSTSFNSPSGNNDSSLLFGKRNFAFLLAGTGLIALGYFLMAGGNMPSSDVWDESLIYSTRRTFIAPLLILAGLGIQAYTIFAKK
jgi:hypothetical protein